MIKIILLSLIVASILLVFTPSPKKIEPDIFPYKIPQVERSQSYLIAIIGDSIVNALGENAELLRQDLKIYYKENEFVTYNYGYSSTNIESLSGRLDSVLDKDLDLIIIESFGYNPLSHYPLEKGLNIQRQILDESVRKMIAKKPNAVIVFMTPIALNRMEFGKGVLDLTQSQRDAWVEERMIYIQNHVAFAKERGIPIIDIYSKTLGAGGDGDLRYIDQTDHIHPSQEGVKLISQIIADFVFEHKIFP